MRFLPVNSWDDWAAIATIASLIIALLAALIAWRQIKHQLVEGRRQSAFNVFLQFSEKFSNHMQMRSDLRDRFERKDTKLRYREIKEFYQDYWGIQINEWEMFRAGLLPLKVYSGWLSYVHDSIVGDFEMGYFDEVGTPKALKSKDAFTDIAIAEMMRSQAECRAFFIKLSLLPHSWCPTHAGDQATAQCLEDRTAAIEALLQEQQEVYRQTRAWKLS